MSKASAKWPNDWPVRSLEKIASQITSGGTPTSGSPRYYVEYGGLPFAKTEDLTRARSKFVEQCELGISEAALEETAAKRYPIGTILVSMYGTIGLTKIAAREMAANQALCALIPPLACDLDYLYHHLDYTRPEWQKYSGQTTQANISGAIVRAHEVPLPAGGEQRKIAQILDTLDIAIHETEAIIAKLKAVKQGLLHDMLTRGIDANGELRPPQAEAPHLYKPSPLGWIPKDWDAKPLGQLVADTYRYPSYFGINYIEVGVPEIRGELIQADGTLSEITEGYRYISEQTASRFPRVRLRPGDVVMTVRGTIGKFALVPPWLEGAVITANLLKLSPDLAIATPDWLMHVLLSTAFQERLDAACSATTIKTIQVHALLAICIASPSSAEQEEISKRLSGLDMRLFKELMSLEKLKVKKSGLMDDLLTGHVRVTPLLSETERATECA